MAQKPTANVKVTDKTADTHESGSLKVAVHEAVSDAADDAKTGNVKTAASPMADLPTGTRRDHPPE